MGDRVRPYLFYDVAVSICPTCLRKVEGKVIFQDGAVYMVKRCPSHGSQKVLLADDVEYYRRCREVFIKPPEICTTSGCPSFRTTASSMLSICARDRKVWRSGPLLA